MISDYPKLIEGTYKSEFGGRAPNFAILYPPNQKIGDTKNRQALRIQQTTGFWVTPRPSKIGLADVKLRIDGAVVFAQRDSHSSDTVVSIDLHATDLGKRGEDLSQK